MSKPKTTDRSENYTSYAKSHIIIGNNNVVIKFKPFIESIKFDTDSTAYKNDALWSSPVYKTKGIKSKKVNLSFNVPSMDWYDAKDNHIRFQRLLRMIMPDIYKSARTNIWVKFANLIHNQAPGKFQLSSEGTNKNAFSRLKDEKWGAHCFVRDFSYEPDIKMGFFDQDGMMFAKNYKINLNLEYYTDSLPYGGRYSSDAIEYGEATKIPGTLFGHSVSYNKKKKKGR
tara:strand:- start:16458 stop:17141 length:684 start_codon:yes stop_codon:yes gene_type:complete